jgi:hypothetical protein
VFRIRIKFASWIRIRIKNAVQDPSACQLASVVDPDLEPQGAGTSGRSRYTEVSALASAPAPGQTQVVNLIIIHIELGFLKNFCQYSFQKVTKNLLFI